MSIYGRNFNGLVIPQGIKSKFAERLNGNLQPVGYNHGCKWLLQGVCESSRELAHMLAVADNGKRGFHVVKRSGYYAVYTGILAQGVKMDWVSIKLN